jgi:hypothetical protein
LEALALGLSHVAITTSFKRPAEGTLDDIRYTEQTRERDRTG